ncbi:hypothetical protein L3X38_025171 [Prunus dulcis]|uniref:Uncharacterized protein n=1 Tax=Prunus dulcis TaxID=3755 RepID=A0AAD4W2C8_PRUDU|nr:hypothetical protein L3X38_025171 [Prunus dulcis]
MPSLLTHIRSSALSKGTCRIRSTKIPYHPRNGHSAQQLTWSLKLLRFRYQITNPSQLREALSVTKAQPPIKANAERPKDLRKESVTQQAKLVEDLELVYLHDDLRIGKSRSKHCAYDPDPERYEAMKAKVDKLSSIGFIKEVYYPT